MWHVVICSGVECWLCGMLSYVVVWNVETEEKSCWSF